MPFFSKVVNQMLFKWACLTPPGYERFQSKNNVKKIEDNFLKKYLQLIITSGRD